MTPNYLRASLAIPLLGILPTLRADVKMAGIFGDHMVLQRDIPLPVWGTADPGEKITVAVGGQEVQTSADTQGKWRVQLKALPMTDKAVEMEVSGSNRVVVHDVLIGDVWMCSGQSNMGFGLGNAHDASEAVPRANHPHLRLFLENRVAALMPQADCSGKWVVCTPQNVIKIGGWNGFSAAAYFFGREILADQKAPVGLLGGYWAGTPAEAWTSLDALQAEPSLRHYEAALAAAGRNPDALDEKGRAQGILKPRAGNPSLATVLFNGMIAPILPFPIKGAIWYQGESNGFTEERAQEYATLFPVMITDWRRRWGEGNFPFLFVQLPNFDHENKPGGQPYHWGSFWPDLRHSQFKTLALPNTGMAVTIDIGEETNIHPKDKVDVGRRLALVARHVAYGEDVEYSGPIYRSMKIEAGKVILAFDHVGSGLMIGSAPPIRLDEKRAAPADHLQAFEIAGTDQTFVPAQAKIEGDAVVVWSDQVPAPTVVRYAWSGYPKPPANLYNRDGLPAPPFATDKR